jgi:deoxyribodipyrimidine photolyase-related protein
MSCLILFPSQLFDNIFISKVFNLASDPNHYIILWEHEHFFNSFPYHKLKLAFHRASMTYYYDQIKWKIKGKIYVESIDSIKNQQEKIKNFIHEKSIKELLFINPIENKLLLMVKNKKLISGLDIEYLLFPSPYFLNSSNFEKNSQILSELKTTRHDLFYKNQRIKYNIMIEKNNGKIIPEGKSWSFDTFNRSPFEKNQIEIKNLEINKGKEKTYIKKAIEYVEKNYKKNYGQCKEEYFIYPISRTDAIKWIDDFIKRKLSNFGKYEDAISDKIIFGYHSVLSPLLNVGIITTTDVLEKINKITNKNIIESKEGFVRQIIGWREYCYFIYLNYSSSLTKNYFYSLSSRNIPKKFWDAQTKIPIIDNILENINKYAYSHHIERLMCVGNFLLLIGVKPEQIYFWFQTMYIDAYDVFMVPNVYGMLLYGFVNDHTHMMTKPYFCSSNYLMKMSNYKTEQIELDGEKYKWDEIIDALYYKLIKDYSKEFKKIYSTSSGVKRYEGFPEQKKKHMDNLSNLYINWLFS